jgi:hypothetical protein
LAVTPKTDEAFLREVDEELRRDRVVHFWRDYGRWTIGAIIAGLLIFAGVLYWLHASNTALESEAVKMQDAVDGLTSGDAAKAKAPIDALAASSSPGNRGTAKMLQADQLLKTNNAKGAAAKFAEVAGDTTIGQPIRDLALIRQTAVEFDTLPPQTVIDRLKPLATKDSAWIGSAGEMTALAYIRLNKPAEARAMFKTIAETDGVPDSLRQRAVQMMNAVSDGATDQKGK